MAAILRDYHAPTRRMLQARLRSRRGVVGDRRTRVSLPRALSNLNFGAKMSLLDLFRTHRGRAWHPVVQPALDANYWCGWDQYTSLVPPSYWIHSQAVIEAVPDGDVLYGIILAGRWRDSALLALRAGLARQLPDRHLLLPHAKGMATLLVYCAPPPEPRHTPTETGRQAALRPAARALANTIYALGVHHGWNVPPPESPIPVEPGTFERFVDLVSRDTRFGRPWLGLNPNAGASADEPNYFNPKVMDYARDLPKGESTGWVKWRHGWGPEMDRAPESYLTEGTVSRERANEVMRRLMRL